MLLASETQISAESGATFNDFVKLVDQVARAPVEHVAVFSETSLLNRFAFAKVYRWQFSRRATMWLEGVSRQGTRIASPIKLREMQSGRLVARFLIDEFDVGPFDLADARRLTREIDFGVEVSYDRDQSDYLYDAAELRYPSANSSVKFGQYQRKLAREHSVTWRVARSSDLGACESVLIDWCRGRDDDDRDSCARALEAAAQGWGRCLLVTIDGEAQAFVIYEMLDPTIAVALFLKTRVDIQGLADYTLRSICMAETAIKTINTCQDLGIPGLRSKKVMLRPVELVHKYFLTRRD